MRPYWRAAVLLLLLVVLLSPCAFARDIFIATNGNDENTGDISSPYATLRKAAEVAVAGDNIYLRAGTYNQYLYWDFGGNGASGAYITIQAYDGDLSAILTNTEETLSLSARTYIKVIGLEVKTGSNVVHVHNGSHHIYIQRCKIHDGGNEADCVKANQADYVYVEDCEIAEPGIRYGGGWQEGIDYLDVDYGAMRRNYVHDFGNMAFYAKGGCENVVIEGNVVVNQQSPDWDPAVGFGGQTDPPLMDGATYQSYNLVMRNNIIRSVPGGAVGTYDCYHGYFYNNIIHNAGGMSGETENEVVQQRMSCLCLDGSAPPDGQTTGFYFYNNVILDTRGTMPTVFGNRSGTYSDWQNGNNNYYNNGNAIPSGGMFNPNAESGATIGNPNLANPTGTATTWAGWKDRYRITASSTLLIDHGNSNAGNSPYPAVTTDMDGNARPQGSGYDIGPFEYGGGGGNPPVANFSGNPTSGAAPLSVAFTDTSTNTPTSWSWAFGDGSTATAQHPSHSYAAGAYTVTLTATNAYGSDGETKTDYITATGTGGTPTFVAAGAVASNAAAITPALPAGIATNDILLLFLETANQAISIANQNGGTWAAVTGSPQGTGTAGGSGATCLTVFWSRYNGTQGAPTTSDSGNHQLGRIIAIRGAATSGNPWDVTAGGVDATADTSGSIPGATTTVANTLVVAAIATALPDASGTANFSAWTNANLGGLTERTDNTVTAGNGGGLGLATGGKATAGAYGSTDVTCATAARKGLLSIALKPAGGGGGSAPVANFTGTPTSGAAPLSVNFTDTSTNTPTSWSWAFGDSSTSTVQNPSHSYAAGTYTVTLTATNAYGSDGETKTNYITAGNPPVANFSGTPTSGAAPLSVAFTDSSTNSPTAWSWSFGDSSTSTVQNPSHSYAAGTYTVTLTATNAYGSDGETKTNYITATGGGSQVYVYPSSVTSTHNVTTISGSLSDTQTDNNVYHVVRCDTSTHQYSQFYHWTTGYTPSQVNKITVDWQWHGSRSDTPKYSVLFMKATSGYTQILDGMLSPTSDYTFSWETTAVSTYLKTDSTMEVQMCGCNQNTNNYDTYNDLVRITFNLN